MPDVSVIIVNYNTVQITKQCISSIYDQCTSIDYEIIVVDNNSSDNSSQVIKENFPFVTIIASEKNIGFGRANNLGIKQARGKYLFLLNSDTILVNNAVKMFFDYMERNNLHGDIGALGCVMLDRNMTLNYRNSYYDFPSLVMLCKESFRDVFPVFKKKYLSDSKRLQTEGYISVDFIVGADLFIPKSVIGTIGDFDSDYFLYWEEVDLQYRMFKERLHRYIIHGPTIIHLEGGSNSNAKNWQRIMESQSLVVFFRKHTDFLSVVLVKFYCFLRMLISLLKNKYTFKEQLDYFKSICVN